MTIRIPKELWFCNQSKEIRSVRWMAKKLCFRVNSSELWAVKQALLPMISHCHSPPTPAPPTHTMSNFTVEWHQCEKKKTWPIKSNNSTTLRAQEDYNVRPIKRIRKINNQRFQGYFPSSHIIFIICQYLLIICYKYHSTLFIDAQK